MGCKPILEACAKLASRLLKRNVTCEHNLYLGEVVFLDYKASSRLFTLPVMRVANAFDEKELVGLIETEAAIYLLRGDQT